MYYATLQATFETEKNKKAFLYTIVICIILLLLAVFIRWSVFQPPVPVIPDQIEINLGNNHEGYGKNQPLIKGEMSPTEQPIEELHQKSSVAKSEASKNIQTDENADKDAAPVIKTKKQNTKAINITKQPISKRINNNPEPVAVSTPKPKKPLFAYNGPGKGNGNGATADNGDRYQGNNPNGHGDNGSPAGKADSYGNTPGGKSGVGISSGLKGRRITQFPSFQDEFNENAKVYVDITVNASGAVMVTSIAKGTTTSNTTIRSIALQKAKSLKFNPGEEDRGTIIFNFKVQN